MNGAERSRARTAAQARSCFLLGSAVCGGAAACARGSPRARNPRGRRIRNLAGGDSEPEQSRLRSRSCCTARHSHRTPFFSRRSRSTSSCSHAPRMRRRWSALVLPWTELARFLAAYAAQALAGAIEAASPPLSPRSVAATSAVLHMLSLCVSGARRHRQMVATGATSVRARAAAAITVAAASVK